MLKPFSRYLTAVEENLPSGHHPLLRNSFYLAILDWYTDGVGPGVGRCSNPRCGRGEDFATEPSRRRSPRGRDVPWRRSWQTQKQPNQRHGAPKT